MNGDALSDFLLATVALLIAWRLIDTRPGVAIGVGLVGAAALLGVPDYLGIVQARGPHNFTSLIAACAGLPLIAISAFWPQDSVASRVSAAARFAVFASGVGVMLVALLGISLWMQFVPAMSALCLVIAGVRVGRLMAIGGAVVLAAAFVMSAVGWSLAPLNGVQQLHVLMAVALLLLGLDQARLSVEPAVGRVPSH